MLQNPSRQFSRSFLTLIKSTVESASSPQSFSVTRTLPHSPAVLYNVVSNVDLYCKFVPYCVESYVTERDANKQPVKATLKVGWNSYEESFESELKCNQPYTVVAQSHHSLFETLYTRWRIIPQAQQSTSKVTLDIKFAFSNPLYNAVSATFAPRVTTIMIEAFEARMAQLQQNALQE
ncbi:polyketide cyclase [Lipomyces arxii]|uniref:polyketide cyclase n=1 Tax=Lipomyces arxii TaxID=56418 RepID=UPI0034CFEB56